MKNRELARNLKDQIYFDPEDCRNIKITCESLCTSAEGVELLETALDLYIKTPEERMERFLGKDSNPA